MKAFLYLLLAFFIQGCASLSSSLSPVDSAEVPLWLQGSFPSAQIVSLRYESHNPQQIKQFELIFDEVADVFAQRQEIQRTLIEQLTNKNHPEGNCVQVEHILRAKKNVFKVLVVCVG